MGGELRENSIKYGRERLRRPRFEDFGHRTIEERVPKTKALTIAAMFDALALRQQQQQKQYQPSSKAVTHKHFPVTPGGSIYGKLRNPILRKEQSDYKPVIITPPTFCKAPTPFVGGVKGISAFRQTTSSGCELQRKSPVHSTVIRRPNVAFNQPSRLIQLTKVDAINPITYSKKSMFSDFTTQKINKLQEETLESSSNMQQKIPVLSAFVLARIQYQGSDPSSRKLKSPMRPTKENSVINPPLITVRREEPESVRASFKVTKAPIFYSTSFPTHLVKHFSTPFTTGHMCSGGQKETDTKQDFAEVTKCTIRNFEINSRFHGMKSQISNPESQNPESPRWFANEEEDETVRDLLKSRRGRLQTSSERSHGDEEAPRNICEKIAYFEKKVHHSTEKSKPRSRSLESAKRISLSYTGSERIRALASSVERIIKKSKDMDGIRGRQCDRQKSNGLGSVPPSQPILLTRARMLRRHDRPPLRTARKSEDDDINIRNSKNRSRTSNPLEKRTTVKCEQSSQDKIELHSIAVQLREKTEIVFHHSNRPSYRGKYEGMREGSDCFRSQVSRRRRIGVYGTIQSRDSGLSEDSESGDVSSDGSRSSPDSLKSIFSEISDYDSGVSEDIEENEPQWHVAYSLSKLMDILLNRSPHKLWCQIPEIFNSEFFRKLTSTERKLQEVKFEIFTTEISYAKSLDVLISHFLKSKSLKDEKMISKEDKEVLFGNIISVRQCSERFLIDLEKCWRKDAYLQDIGEIIHKHAESNFRVYIAYCRNQVLQGNTLDRLMKSEEFSKVIQDLESDPVCQGLTLYSFLILPMQRVTRIRLLVDGIMARIPVDDIKYKDWNQALITINKIVQDCDDEAKYESLNSEMKIINEQMDFSEVGKIDLLRKGRYLIKKGELFHYCCSGYPHHLGITSMDSTSVNAFCLPGFGRKIIKESIHLFLFTDLMVIAKKKSNENFTVLDYCPRDFVEILTGDPCILQELLKRNFSEYKNIFHLFIYKNCENRNIEMILSTSGETEKELWLKAFETFP